jgi:cleavage and polyadenylation specificity factor subunit 3
MAVVLLVAEYTDMSMSQVIQRQSIHYSGGLPVLRHLLTQVAGNAEVLEDKKLRVFQNVEVTLDNKIVTLEVHTLLYCTQRDMAVTVSASVQ